MSKKKLENQQSSFFFGTITHVESSTIFYAVDAESLQQLAEIKQFLLNAQVDMMFWIPEINERFLFNTENGCFRCRRLPFEKQEKEGSFMIQLEDTGEKFIINVKDLSLNDFYMLPDEITLDPLAIKYEWLKNDIDCFNEYDKSTFLKSHIYEKLTFEVVETMKNNAVLIWPFNNDDDHPRDIEENFVESNRGGNDRISLTEKEVKVFYEEPLNTESALIAAQGFITHDDDRLCQFYDPKTGGCFKGGLCNQIHLPKLKDGFERRDKKEIFFEEPYDGFLPTLFQYFDVKITHFIQLDRFVCHLFDDDETADTLAILNEKLNDAKEVKAYTIIKDICPIAQLVLVKRNDHFYRARILNIIDCKETYEVFLVDEGIFDDIHISNVYEWNSRLNEFKFQATEMTLVGIEKISHKEKDGIKEILEIQRKSHQPLKVFLVENIINLKCKLFDAEGNDVSQILIEKGFAKSAQISPSCTINTFMIPM